MIDLPMNSDPQQSNRRKVVTTVYLSFEQDQRLKTLRRERNVNVAEFIRMAIDRLLKEVDPRPINLAPTEDE